MPGLTPSSPINASGTARGLVSTIAQTFAGAKTFLARAVFSLGIASGAARLDLRSDLGAGASDVCSVAGSTAADASVNAAAVLLAIRTGIGATEVDSITVLKGGVMLGTNGVATVRLNGSGSALVYGTASLTVTSIYGAFLAAGPFLAENTQADGADRSVLYANCRSAWSNLSSNLLYLQNDEVDRVRVNPFGMFRIFGSDSSASPGVVTIDKPIGKSAIAIGAATVRITNSLVSAASHIIITPHARDATCKEIIAVPGAGFFDVSGTANATAALPFSWEVKGLL